MRRIHRLLRRFQLRTLARLDPEVLIKISERRLLERFHAVARRVPAYAAILVERGIRPERIKTSNDVLTHCPILEKADVFGRFPLARLCVGGDLSQLSSVLTSSGHGSRFAFGLSTERQARHAARAVEFGLEYAFQTDQYRTLLINALPMGVRFACTTVAVAETSVREDMICALVKEIAPYFEQVILVLDPLFAKRMLDYGRAIAIDWGRMKTHVILGEETFGEHFRGYLAERLEQNRSSGPQGLIGSSMGIGELGLNLFFETRETIALRQLASRRPEFGVQAIGVWPGATPPLLFVYDPRRVYVEVDDPDQQGFGDLVVSTLDASLMLPLLRYRTGDRAKILDRDRLRTARASAGDGSRCLPPLPILALAGRNNDFLPDGRALLDIKDALYADHAIADELSGAFRVERKDDGYAIQVQMRGASPADPNALGAALERLLPRPPAGGRDYVQVWQHEAFPYGRTLDYERKFDYWPSGPAAA